MKLILSDRNLAICNLYSPPNKAINLQILQQNSEDWMIVGDFNSHSPGWGYPSLDAKVEEVEHWIVSNRLVLINTPTDPPTFYSRVWKTTSTPDIVTAADNIQKIAKREVSQELGGSDLKPVILTLAKQFNTSAVKMPPPPPPPPPLPHPAGTTRRQTGSASGNSLTSTPSRSPSPNTVSTRMPPTSTLQSSKQRKSILQEVDGMTTSHTGTIPWRTSTRN